MKKIFILTVMMLSCSIISIAADKNDSAETVQNPNTFRIPKGTIGGGVTFSYNDYNIGTGSDDIGYTMLFSMLKGIKGDMMSFGISPHLSYFVADNLSIGLKFDYDRSMIDHAMGQLSLGDSMSFGVNDYNYFSHTYSGAFTCRYYMPFTNSKHFAVFAEGRAVGGYGQTESYKAEGTDKFGTYQDVYKFSLDFVPGLAVFFTENIAFEVAVGVLGFNWQKIEQTTNQVDKSIMTKSGANCNINLLKINVGMSFYIPTGKKK